jgi:hypothetical protein
MLLKNNAKQCFQYFVIFVPSDLLNLIPGGETGTNILHLEMPISS